MGRLHVFTMKIHCKIVFSLIGHPCDTIPNGGCAQICQKSGKLPSCLCKDGYETSDRGITCTASMLFLYPSISIFSLFFVYFSTFLSSFQLYLLSFHWLNLRYCSQFKPPPKPYLLPRRYT